MVNVIALCSFDHYGLRWRGEIFAVSAQTAADLARAGLVAVSAPPPEQVQTEQVQTEQVQTEQVQTEQVQTEQVQT
ncbi:hypothetical protein, partial [Conchiformibius steedae]